MLRCRRRDSTRRPRLGRRQATTGSRRVADGQVRRRVRFRLADLRRHRHAARELV